MSHTEYTLWKEFYSIDPFGGYRTDVNFAALKTWLGKLQISTWDGRVEDMLLFEQQPSQPLTELEQAELLSAHFKAIGARKVTE